MTSTTTAAARDLLAVVLDGVEPAPDASALAALHAALRRQVVAAGPAVALAAVRRLSTAPGPACIDTRRARFAGIAAVLGSTPTPLAGHRRPVADAVARRERAVG